MDDTTGAARPVRAAVGAVVIVDARLLLVRRAHDPQAGRWSLPGGRVEAGESLRGAVVREVAEETGLHVDVGAVVGVVERDGPGVTYRITDFDAVVRAGTARAGDDATALVWASAHDLERLALVDGLAEFLAAHGVTSRLRP